MPLGVGHREADLLCRDRLGAFSPKSINAGYGSPELATYIILWSCRSQARLSGNLSQSAREICLDLHIALVRLLASWSLPSLILPYGGHHANLLTVGNDSCSHGCLHLLCDC